MIYAELLNITFNGKLLTKKVKASLIRTEKSAELIKLLVIYSGNDGSSKEINWINVTDSLNATVNTGYRLKNDLSRVIIKLPLAASTSDRLCFYNDGISGFRIEQRENQQIRIGNKLTTKGLQGGIVSYELGDYLELVYINNFWYSLGIAGNLEVL